MFSRALTLVLALSYAWGRNPHPEVIKRNLLEILAILRARADAGGLMAFYTTVIRWVDSSCWSVIHSRIKLEHDSLYYEGLSAEALEGSMKSHFEALVKDQRAKLHQLAKGELECQKTAENP